MKNSRLILMGMMMILFVRGYGWGLADAPVLYVENDHFISPPVLEKTDIVHEFIVTNKGQSILRIEKVKTGCGCVATTYTREIMPGTSGKISVRVNTVGYGGRDLSKTIRVESNDPKKGILKLHVTGRVEKFAVIEPDMVYLTGGPDDQIQARVRISPRPKYPFRIKDLVANNLKGRVEYRLVEDGKQYVLIIKNLLKKPGLYNGRIHLKTGHPVRPEIVIRVFGNIKKRVTQY